MQAPICKFIDEQSSLIWERIRFSRERKIRISETTITENLLFSFQHYARKNKLAIEIFESKDEATSGTDLLIFIESDHGFLQCPCQAKIIDSKGRYQKIGHKVAGKYQIDLLLEYANHNGAAAGYLLYNYVERSELLRRAFKLITTIDIERFGLSWCSAQGIRQAFFPKAGGRVKIPNFDALHYHYALPLADLICKIINSEIDIEEIAAMYEKLGDVKLQFLSRDDVDQDQNWENISPRAQIGFIIRPGEGLKSDDRETGLKFGFKPKFKIVFEKERRQSLFVKMR